MKSISRLSSSAALGAGMLVSLLATAGCAARSGTAPTPVIPAESSEAHSAPALVGISGEQPELRRERHVGDLWVQRFSGTYRDVPVTLEEEVVARDGDLWVVDYRLEEGDEVEELRVRMSTRSERIISVHRLRGGEETPCEAEAFERLIEKTSFAPERNTGHVASAKQTCLIGPDEFECQVDQYELVVDDAPATLSVAKNDELARDVSGEVVAVDGTILYRAEIVEMREGSDGPVDDSVAWAE